VIAVVLLAAVAQASPAPPVVVSVATPETVRVVVGAIVQARVVVTIKEGFRIQANPASGPYLVPARLKLEGDGRVRVGPAEYPAGKPYRLRGASGDLSVYEGTFVMRVPLEAPRSAGTDATSGLDLVLEGTLEYQACNSVVCLKPSSVRVRVPVRIEPERRRPPSR
jgi:hypothetical protein